MTPEEIIAASVAAVAAAIATGTLCCAGWSCCLGLHKYRAQVSCGLFGRKKDDKKSKRKDDFGRLEESSNYEGEQVDFVADNVDGTGSNHSEVGEDTGLTADGSAGPKFGSF